MAVLEAADGPDGLAQATCGMVDVVVLDWMLPSLDGLEVLRRLRLAGVGVPVLLLTARGAPDDRILGLEVGADDYVAKPFSPRELLLRVRSLLRRAGADPAPAPIPGRKLLEDGDVRLDLLSHKASRGGEPLRLTTREFDLLAHLIGHPEQVWSREELMQQVWGWEFGDPSTVTVHVRRLRGKVEVDPAHPERLITVWGRGYRWDPTPAVAS